MIYYLTATGPLVFTTQKAEKVEEWMITAMLENLLKREYETYEPKEAADNIQYCLQIDSVFREVPTPPTQEPREADVKWWVDQFLMTEAGQKLQSQVNQPLYQKKMETELNLDEITLSDYLPSLAIASEWDSAGPSLHSQQGSQSASEA